MTGWWPGDGNTDDIVGGRNAVLHDNATTGPGFVDDRFLLDGAGDFVEVPHDLALNVGTGDFTVDLWVNFNTTAGEQVLVEKYVENFSLTPPGWFLTKLGDNSLRFGTGPASGGHGVTSAPLSLPDNTWIHFAARRSGGVASIFVNGMEVATAPFVVNADSDSSLKFGHRGSPDDTPGSTDTRGFFLNGGIDEVELFVGRALSDMEIQAIVIAGDAGKCKVSDLAIMQTDSPDPVKPNKPLTYTISVTNNGPSDATGVTLTDTLSAQVTFVSATSSQGSCNESGGIVTCELGSVANGTTATVTIIVKPKGGKTKMITNVATVTGNESDANGINNTATETTKVGAM
jgi:uncharacterized repeat protein (TIGR01451 family)